MTSSQKSKLAAVIGYLLVAVVVLGGMTWATVATFELAKRNLREESLRNDLLAVSELDSYMRGILRSEKARPFTDYMAFHTTPFVEVWDQASERMFDAGSVIVQSPLKEFGPPYEWIDLYFQIHQSGEWCSPHFGLVRPGVDVIADSALETRAADTMNWFRAALPEFDLWEWVQQHTRQRTQPQFTARPSRMEGPTVERNRLRDDRGRRIDIPAIDYQRRHSRNIAAQEASLPTSQCVHVIEQDTDPSGRGSLRRRDEAHYVCAEEAVLGIIDEPMYVDWLPQLKDGSRKLIFLREGYDEGQRVLQGFIGDWHRLAAELLAQVEPLFPNSALDLVPVEDTVDADSAARALSSIPARLSVPELPGGLALAAWRSIRGQLYLTWAITAVVLVLAGWGVHNLVALTNRRMQFAYAVTHELRTPLTTFRLYADMLCAGLVPDDAKEKYLDTLNTESIRLSALVESILEYARLENHKVTLNPVDTDATALLASIVEGVEKRCKAHGVEARTHNAVANGQVIHTDVELVGQIAGVLVNNACRHTKKASTPTILVQLATDDETLHLDVIDNGPGIDRGDVRTIFKPFRRGRNAAAAAQGGVGLGLALAREWAKLLGGRLDLTARQHQELGGAHFRLTIPTRS